MAHLSLGVLGPLQALLDEAPVTTFESDKVCALLVYLAVEADRPHRRESLVGLLWPECPEQVARHNLRQALFSLRRAIGDHAASPPYLLISRDAIQFNRVSDFSLDLAQFNTLLHMCEENRNQGVKDPWIRAARLEEMVKLYRGEFLQHFFLEDSAEFEEWALVQRESLHQGVLDACSELASYYERHGDYQAARRHASRQLELDPWREEAHCQMMRALALDGQRTAALAQYETCRRILAEELGVEPSARMRELYEQIRAGMLQTKEESPSSIPTTPIRNLPVALTSFVGREQELFDLSRLIADAECRCISLVGPGGIGKTRLALQAAEQLRAGFAHGVAFVPLAPVGSGAAAIAAMADAIHLAFYGPRDPGVQLLNTLCEKQMLLILDNVEQLLGKDPPQTSFVEIVLEILERAPGVKLLVTSRETLNLQGEWVFEVGGLAFPELERTEGLHDYAAVALFVQRARRASPGFAFYEADLAAIAQLCRLVEGMPLAIELAATWARMLSPAEIAQEIEASLDVLSASVRDLPERHRSMRVVFDQTWRTLSAKEQQVLSQLSVFRGGFGRQAAEQVAGASLPVLSTLVNRTLLRRTAPGRYGLHPLVRQYGAMHLAADACAHAAAHKRHYAFFLALAETADQELKGANQLEWLNRLDQELDNLRLALECALSSQVEKGLQMAACLHWFWIRRNHFTEGVEWLERLLMAQAQQLDAQTLNLAGSVARGRALNVLAYILRWEDENDMIPGHPDQQARMCAQEGQVIFEKLGEAYRHDWAISRFNQAHSVDDFLACRHLFRDLEDRFWTAECDERLLLLHWPDGEKVSFYGEEDLALRREFGDVNGEGIALLYLGRLDTLQGNLNRAFQRLFDALACFDTVGNRTLAAFTHNELATNYLIKGDYEGALRHAQMGRTLAEELNRALVLEFSIHQAGLAWEMQEYELAVRYCEEALEVARNLPIEIKHYDTMWILVRVALSQGDTASARAYLNQVSWPEMFSSYVDRGVFFGYVLALGLLSALEGQAQLAVSLLSAQDRWMSVTHNFLFPRERSEYDQALASARAALGEEGFCQAWEAGRAMTEGQVFDFAMQVLGGEAGG